jgi:hypothetical protein
VLVIRRRCIIPKHKGKRRQVNSTTSVTNDEYSVEFSTNTGLLILLNIPGNTLLSRILSGNNLLSTWIKLAASSEHNGGFAFHRSGPSFRLADRLSGSHLHDEATPVTGRGGP